MSLRLGRTFEAVVVAVVSMLCASVSDAQSSYTPMPVFPSSESPGNIQFQSEANRWSGQGQFVSINGGPFYVACWAEVPSHSTAYFSATFQAPAVSSARKEFRKLVTTQYGQASKVQCTGKFSQAVVNERVEQWKDSARTTKNAIVDTDWPPSAALHEPLPSAAPPQDGRRVSSASPHAAAGFPPEASVPGNSNLGGTAANQASFQR